MKLSPTERNALRESVSDALRQRFIEAGERREGRHARRADTIEHFGESQSDQALIRRLTDAVCPYSTIDPFDHVSHVLTTVLTARAT